MSVLLPSVFFVCFFTSIDDPKSPDTWGLQNGDFSNFIASSTLLVGILL